MIIDTDRIINILEDLENKTGKDLEHIKEKLINSFLSYEKDPEKLFDNQILRLTDYQIKINGKALAKRVKRIKYFKKNKSFEITFYDETKRIEKYKDITIDLNVSLEKLLKLFNF